MTAPVCAWCLRPFSEDHTACRRIAEGKPHA